MKTYLLMPQPCPSTVEDSDATLVSEDTDAIDVIRAQRSQYNNRQMLFAMQDIAKLFLQYPDMHQYIIDKTEEVFFATLDEMYNRGTIDPSSDDLNIIR